MCHAFASVHCCLAFTCWERADLLAFVCDVTCVFVTFPCGILGQLLNLIVSIPDLCQLSYFYYFCEQQRRSSTDSSAQSDRRPNNAREPLYSKGAVITWWLQSTSAQNSVPSCLKE